MNEKKFLACGGLLKEFEKKIPPAAGFLKEFEKKLPPAAGFLNSFFFIKTLIDELRVFNQGSD